MARRCRRPAPCRRSSSATARCSSRSPSMPPAVKAWEPVRKQAEQAVRAIPGVQSVMVALTAERAAAAATSTGATSAGAPARPQPAPGARPRHAAAGGPGGGRPGGRPGGEPVGVPGVAAIIAVASGKGGVGKSTTAVNLALGFARPRPESRRARRRHLRSLVAEAPGDPRDARRRWAARGSSRSTRYGLTVMSIGFLIEEETPMIWRGPMVMSALTQMLREVEWGDARRDGGRHAARHRRRPAHHGAAGAAERRGDRLHAAGPGADRRAARHRHVQARQRAGARHRREHEHLHLPELRRRVPISSAMAARGTRRSGSACRSSARCRWTWRSAKRRTPACRSSRRDPTAPQAEIYRDDRRGGPRAACRCAVSRRRRSIVIEA